VSLARVGRTGYDYVDKCIPNDYAWLQSIGVDRMTIICTYVQLVNRPHGGDSPAGFGPGLPIMRYLPVVPTQIKKPFFTDSIASPKDHALTYSHKARKAFYALKSLCRFAVLKSVFTSIAPESLVPCDRRAMVQEVTCLNY
jgi:hypothetical protein